MPELNDLQKTIEEINSDFKSIEYAIKHLKDQGKDFSQNQANIAFELEALKFKIDELTQLIKGKAYG